MNENISALKVMKSAAGYYIGKSMTVEEDWGLMEYPYSRHSEYFKTKEQAQEALDFTL